MSPPVTVPTATADPINARILAVSEDCVSGFHADPFAEIARLAGLDVSVVLERLRALLAAGTIRRVRQTLMATNLAPGALVAWQMAAERLDAAFDFMFQQDPFSGHVVIRTTDAVTPAARYRLWTTLKVPQGFSMVKHCDYLLRQTSAQRYRLMPARCLFVLGVGHVRRRGMAPGDKSDQPADTIEPHVAALSDLDWRVLEPLKREFAVEEIGPDPWRARAAEVGVSFETFLEVARSLHERRVIGRFSTFLEHVKLLATGERVTRFNALFHWAVPPGRELEAGREIGRHHILTHAYWREGGPEFHAVNLMAVAHGQDRALLLEHKAAIDRHLASIAMPVRYTNVFWGGRSEIKPSEVSPREYQRWCASMGIDAATMRA